MSTPVVIGFGGNVGDDAAITDRFVRAREALSVIGAVRSAPLYRSAPIGPRQPAFLNTAVEVMVQGIGPQSLLDTVLELELRLGRVRGEKWGPRAIDLDLLLWGAKVFDLAGLQIPHLELANRRFALAPIVALYGEHHEIPGRGQAGPLLARVADQQIEQLADTW